MRLFKQDVPDTTPPPPITPPEDPTQTQLLEERDELWTLIVASAAANCACQPGQPRCMPCQLDEYINTRDRATQDEVLGRIRSWFGSLVSQQDNQIHELQYRLDQMGSKAVELTATKTELGTAYELIRIQRTEIETLTAQLNALTAGAARTVERDNLTSDPYIRALTGGSLNLTELHDQLGMARHDFLAGLQQRDEWITKDNGVCTLTPEAESMLDQETPVESVVAAWADVVTAAAS